MVILLYCQEKKHYCIIKFAFEWKKKYIFVKSIVTESVKKYRIIMCRLFIAFEFVPDKDFLAFYARICQSFTKLDRFNLVKPELMHITLKFLGETAKTKIPTIREGIQYAVKDISTFEVKMEKIGIFGSRYQPRVLWMGISSTKTLQQLYKQLQKEMKQIGFKPDFGNFVPHLTLARINKIDDKHFFWKKIESLPQDFVQQLQIDKIILYESQLHGHIPVYQKIAEILMNDD